mmetsp:Transcript_47686/g.149429  ORF Transcript_47686/g.149429 Transcript_47686/m.149429 type:complete len:105 (-) Transcript_47686:323-637(-)
MAAIQSQVKQAHCLEVEANKGMSSEDCNILVKCHVQAIFQPRSDVSGSNRIDVAPALPVRLQPLKEPTDGRWPFHPSTWNMSKDVCKALAVTPVVIILKDKTVV